MTFSPATEERLRHGFRRYLNPFMVLLWRLGLGRWFNAWPDVGGQIMVIVHTGRKTGARRLSPVNYALAEGDVYALAGFGRVSDWYLNLRADPEVELWLPEGRWRAVAEDVSEDPRRLQLVRQVMIASGFAARVFGLDPRPMSDLELARVTARYPLLRFRRTEALTGPGGPGDLAWVWLVLAAVWMFGRMVNARRARRRRS